MSALRVPSTRERAALRDLLGARCMAAREHLRLSQRALAAMLDMSPSWVREVEHGGQFAPWWFVVILAEAVGRPVGWFVGVGVVPKKPTPFGPRPLPEASLAGATMSELREKVVRDTLMATEGNRKRAAELLDVGERTVYRVIEEFGLERVHLGEGETQ